MNRISQSLIVVLVVFSLLALSSCHQKPGQEQSVQNRAYERVLKTKTLYVAYISYPPSFIKDANTGEYSGIMHEVLQEMAKRLDLKVEYTEETAWGPMIEAVNE